ncbi:GCN5 family acetyltransferase [Afipia sp. P52-10]|uniref:GNAT family N-acetyltransferase n=1 Tax=Afipia sp. P52-10 TaxID=1429916 RepID=UPI0003DF1229|nr:GNAT family N-acetyltransferase [Afipia sp. P52-10]ETR75142.1 GCN5 family acetyltransferase [Afipia sp. P52-10]
MTITIERADPGSVEILPLLLDGERYSASLYPAESNHIRPVEALRAANVHFIVARKDKGAVIGTAALVLFGDWAEVKRMWVVPAERGKGISKALLDDLESRAREEGVSLLRLETGIRNDAALALYARAGFESCGPFADYAPDPLSVFMQKAIT